MSLLDLVFPKKCVGCGRFGAYVCEQCNVGMWEEEQICPSCCRNSRYGLRHTYCRGLMDGLICLWAYEGLTKKLISRAKYYHFYDYLNQLIIDNEQLTIRPEFEYLRRFLIEKPVAVPVPLYPKRQQERGFNQAEKIAKLVASNQSLAVSNLLIRIKDTKQQVGRSRVERLESMEDAFNTSSLVPLLQKEREIGSVLLIDDVWTTGATMSECAKVLKKAGVKKVWGLVLAR